MGFSEEVTQQAMVVSNPVPNPEQEYVHLALFQEDGATPFQKGDKGDKGDTGDTGPAGADGADLSSELAALTARVAALEGA